MLLAEAGAKFGTSTAVVAGKHRTLRIRMDLQELRQLSPGLASAQLRLLGEQDSRRENVVPSTPLLRQRDRPRMFIFQLNFKGLAHVLLIGKLPMQTPFKAIHGVTQSQDHLPSRQHSLQKKQTENMFAFTKQAQNKSRLISNEFQLLVVGQSPQQSVCRPNERLIQSDKPHRRIEFCVTVTLQTKQTHKPPSKW